MILKCPHTEWEQIHGFNEFVEITVKKYYVKVIDTNVNWAKEW